MEQASGHSSISGHSCTPSVNIAPNVRRNVWDLPSGFSGYRGSNDASLFSSSLPVLRHETLNFTVPEHGHRSIDDTPLELDKLVKNVNRKETNGAFDLSNIGVFLPDEDELLAGIIDDFDSCKVDDGEDCDIFGSGGGMELDFDPSESLMVGVAKTSTSDECSGDGVAPYNIPNGVGTINGEHPYGEHPSRTLFVRNINSNVEDSELRSLFEQYGDIRTLYTACKHRGFVMISYYDIRSARTAMRALQNKPLRRRKLDIHFSIPKENPPEKDVNQGTLVAFNLDPSVTNDDLRLIFGVYGEVKEIRETPHKRHHKFIEFYDVRAAEAALRALNRSDIAGKRIKLEPSRPGGARRNLIQQLNQDLEHDETRSYRHQVGSPITNSPPGSWAQFGSPSDNNPLRAFSQSPTFGAGVPMVNNQMPGLVSTGSPLGLNSIKIAPIERDQIRANHVDHVFSTSSCTPVVPSRHSHSFPERSGMMPNSNLRSGNLSSFGPSNSSMSAVSTLTGAQFLWGNPIRHSEPQTSGWPASSMGRSFTSSGQGQGQGLPYSNRQSSIISSSHHHIGSAPSGAPFERHFGYLTESPESSFMSQVGFGSMDIGRTEGNLWMNTASRKRYINPGVSLSGNTSENGSLGIRMSPRLGHMYLGSALFPGPGPTGVEGSFERGRTLRVDNSGTQLDCKKQYQLDLEKIVRGEDSRTTLMLKNIPNKYTSKMLLAAIDENHSGTYDFLYLPIDFKNKCNVGYAFINMVSPSHIVHFYQDINGKKWEKFNSEKVASLAYARIQGKGALVAHFQNSSLMNEDKRCRPILFHSEGQEDLDQELFPSNGLNIYVRQQDGSLVEESAENHGDPYDKLDEFMFGGLEAPL